MRGTSYIKKVSAPASGRRTRGEGRGAKRIAGAGGVGQTGGVIEFVGGTGVGIEVPQEKSGKSGMMEDISNHIIQKFRVRFGTRGGRVDKSQSESQGGRGSANRAEE